MLFVLFYVVIVGFKFDFRLVMNEISSKLQSVEGRSCSDIDSCFGQDVYVFVDRCRECCGTLFNCSISVSCNLLSKRQYMCIALLCLRIPIILEMKRDWV